MDEIWMVVIGSKNKYKVSNFGNVWSNINNRQLTIKPNNHKYVSVGIMINGIRKSIGVHKLVAIHFLENPNGFVEINHKDADKSNNNVNNLEWCSHKQNMNHSANNMLNQKQRNCCTIDHENVLKTYRSITDASIQLQIKHHDILHACNGKIDATKGFRFRYYDSLKQTFIKTRFDVEGMTWINTAKHKIICNETNQIFESQMEASRILKIQQPKISKLLRGLVEDVDGYTFTYL